jgi:hypothetical protein
MESGDIGRLELVTNSVKDLERRLPYTVECICGEQITTKAVESVECKTWGDTTDFAMNVVSNGHMV